MFTVSRCVVCVEVEVKEVDQFPNCRVLEQLTSSKIWYHDPDVSDPDP